MNYVKVKSKELTRYLTFLDDQIFWQSRKEYFQMLDLSVNKKITLDQLFKQFYGLRSLNLKASKIQEENLEAEACGILIKLNEIDFQLNPEYFGFIKIISSLHTLINLCDPDITLDMNLKHLELIGCGIGKEFLKLDLKDSFLPKIA